MKKMFEYELVRRLFYVEGQSKREIERKTGFHRKTINKMLLYSSPPGYRLGKPRRKVKLELFVGVIDEMLASDKNAPKKQHHTAKRVYERLKEEHGFTGSYTIVKDYVREKKTRSKEVFFPLEQRPGTSQTDFGQAKGVIGGKQVTAHFFCMALPFSDAVFVKAYPTEALEAVQDGHASAYAFFKGVPPTNLYDNARTIVKGMFKEKDRELTDGFLALRSHYLFDSRFCHVRKANEKGVVETLIGYVRKNFFVPVPSFPDWDALNAHLAEQCAKRLTMKPAGKNRTVGELLDEERKEFRPLPTAPFDACRLEERHATSLSLVHFQGNAYSVPVEYAYGEVTVKGYVDRVVICCKDAVLAEHKRSYEKDDTIFEPVHYLPLLERKPGGLDGAMPFSSWELPPCFDRVRRFLEGRNGVGGKREYILILQLLRNHPLPMVKRAIEKAMDCNSVKFESVKMLLMAESEPAFKAVPLSEEWLVGLPKVEVAVAEPGRYAALLGTSSWAGQEGGAR